MVEIACLVAGYATCWFFHQRIVDWFHSIPAAARAEADALIQKAKDSVKS